MDNELSKTSYTFRMTSEERQALTELGKIEGSESNAIRRAIKMLMQSRGLEVSPNLFKDKEPGNRLPKENRQLLTTANNAILAA